MASRVRWGLVLAVLAVGGAWMLGGPVGVRVTDGRHDRGRNGIWIGHGYLGDDRWFEPVRPGRDKAAFRSPARLAALARRLRAHGVSDVFAHLCPADEDGTLPGVDAAQVARVLEAFRGMRVLPWVGGNTYKTARFREPRWRAGFVASCAALLARFPGLAGVHVNLEPCRSGDPALLQLLVELRRALPPGSLLSISAYPPPTELQPGLDVHWEQAYVREVARRVDQLVFMMYDTGLTDAWTYQRLMRRWTVEALAWSAPKATLIGLPAYEDAWASYHRPDVENLAVALPAVHAGLQRALPAAAHYQGTALYCEWEMDAAKWACFREQFVRAGR